MQKKNDFKYYDNIYEFTVLYHLSIIKSYQNQFQMCATASMNEHHYHCRFQSSSTHLLLSYFRLISNLLI